MWGLFDNDDLNGGDGDDNLYGGTENDSLKGGDGKDRLFGGSGNNSLFGGDGDDTLNGIGFNQPPTTGAAGSDPSSSIDVLRGGKGADTFLLGGTIAGRSFGAFYVTAGNADYALMTDFNKSEDKISLAKEQRIYLQEPVTIEYSLGASPSGLPSGTAIFANNLGAKPELIAILQGVSPESLSLSPDYFI